MKMLVQLHLAAQYLATAGISFLDKKQDDSHTNLGFSITEKNLQTWPFDATGTKLCLDYPNFALKWTDNQEIDAFPLHGKSHKDVIEWMEKTSKSLGLGKPYAYNLHYELPYTTAAEERFMFSDPSEIEKLIDLRSMAQTVLGKVLDEENLGSDIRIWPHHFDTGAFSTLKSKDIAVGFGLSIPDSMVNDHYFYISGYKGNEEVETSVFTALSVGDWLNQGFKGGILPTSGIDETTAVRFFIEAFNSYKS